MFVFFRSLVLPVDYTNVAGSVMWVFGMPFAFNDSFEATVRSRFIFYNTLSTIGFLEGVSSGKVFTIAVFMLLFNVMGMGIVYTVLEFIVSL